MADKIVVEDVVVGDETNAEPGPDRRRTETQVTAPIIGGHHVSDEEFDNEDAMVDPKVRQERREAKRPNIDHLLPGTAVLDSGEVIPLFEVGDRIVAERRASQLDGNPWLDTRVYIVRQIDDETGAVRCADEEMLHHAAISFKDPLTRVCLCPPRGSPFAAGQIARAQAASQNTPGAGATKKKGRPRGTKNRTKEEIARDNAAKAALKAAKKAERQERRLGSRKASK